MSTTRIRPMAEGQLEATLGVWHRSMVESNAWLRPEQCHTAAEDHAFFRDVIVPQCEIWVASRGAGIIGMLAMSKDEIDRLYVDPKSQRLGVGAALIGHAKTLHPTGLHLVTLEGNAPARRFYGRHGFVVCGRGVSPAPECEPDLLYRWVGLDA